MHTLLAYWRKLLVSPATEFDEFALEAQRVIDTVEWTGS
jgi:hypothetical protein